MLVGYTYAEHTYKFFWIFSFHFSNVFESVTSYSLHNDHLPNNVFFFKFNDEYQSYYSESVPVDTQEAEIYERSPIFFC
jgi:hypothetical protein